MEFYDVGTSDLRELWDSYLVESVSTHSLYIYIYIML